MNILTKILAVVAAVLAVALVALMVSFVAQTEDVQTKFTDEQMKSKTAEAAAANKESQLQQLRANENKQISDLKAESSGLRDQLNGLTTRLAEAESLAASEQARSAALNATIQGLTAANQQHAAVVNALNVEVQQRRDLGVEAQTRVIQLTDRVAELENTNETLVRQVRRQEQANTQLSEENVRLLTRAQQLGVDLAAAPTGTTPAPGATQAFPADRPITGQITKLEKVEDSTFAQINVGRRDGVQPNMKFLVYRGNNQFLGTLVTTHVDESAAAGRIVFADRPINQGDSVYSGPTRQ